MNQLPTTLKRLAGHIHHLRTEAYENPLGTPPPKETPGAHTGGNPKPPTNLTTLAVVIDADQRLQELSLNVAGDLAIPTPPTPRAAGEWCAWLYRHHTELQQLDWYDDLAQEIIDMEADLAARIAPPATPHIEQRQTGRSITRRLATMGHKVSTDTLRLWAHRGKITAHADSQGRNRYLLSEVLDNIEE